MREFNKIYTNKNNKNLNQVEDYYNNIRDSYEKLFAKIKKVVEKTKWRRSARWRLKFVGRQFQIFIIC